MRFLEERIRKEGKVFPGNILKVDSFLNHQIDPALISEIAEGFQYAFAKDHITKVLTVEVSGIAVAAFTALKLGVPMVFAKKTQGANMDSSVYSAKVFSFTKNIEYEIRVAKEYITAGDRLLIVDDFLANGKALEGLVSIAEQAEATVVGAAMVIEKGFTGSGDRLRADGLRIVSGVIIDSMNEDGSIVFRG